MHGEGDETVLVPFSSDLHDEVVKITVLEFQSENLTDAIATVQNESSSSMGPHLIGPSGLELKKPFHLFGVQCGNDFLLFL
jgi:hypothetical protein